MKKYLTTVYFAKIAVFGFMLFSTLVNAQTDLPDAPDDTAPAPIDDYVWILALVGLFYVFLRVRDITKQRNLK